MISTEVCITMMTVGMFNFGIKYSLRTHNNNLDYGPNVMVDQ